jgi:hypothetical protein
MKTIAKEPDDRFPSAADFAMALRNCLPGEVREDAIRSVPPADDSQRFQLEAQRAAAKDPSLRPPVGAGPGARPSPEANTSDAGRTSMTQSPVLWAALGAGAMLLVGAAIAAVVLLLR